MGYFRIAASTVPSVKQMLVIAITASLLVLVFLPFWDKEDPRAPSHNATTATLTVPSPTAVRQAHLRQQCQAMFTVDKGHHGDIWYFDNPYKKLSSQLMHLLPDLDIMSGNMSGSAEIFMGTRLQLMDGSIPYIPCKIREYEMEDVVQCSSARAAVGSKTWIAFVGDSNGRQKVNSFLSFLPPELTYTFYLGDTEVTREEFISAVYYHVQRPPTFDILGRLPSSTASSSKISNTSFKKTSTTSTTSSKATTTSSKTSTTSSKKTSTTSKASKVNPTTFSPSTASVPSNNPPVNTRDRYHTDTGVNEGERSLKEYLDEFKNVYGINGHNVNNKFNDHNSNIEFKSHNVHNVLNGHDGLTEFNDYNEPNEVNGHTESKTQYGNNGQNKIDDNGFVRYNATYKPLLIEPEEEDPLETNYSFKELLEKNVPLDSYDLRVTLVWAPYGSLENISSSGIGTDGHKVTKLEDWVTSEVVPDVIVVGFGTWHILMRQTHGELEPFTKLHLLGHPLVHTLTQLAHMTRLLSWSQSRYRWFNLESDDVSRYNTPPEDYFGHLLYMNQFNDTIPLVDTWIRTMLRSTGAWQWDTTLPFNLANLKECQALRRAGFYNHSFYKGRWWNCNDVHHASYETNSVEIQMLLNLLCNTYLTNTQQHCCS
ncbi:uncharacterized protein LOC121874669 [Homarus americanus]|uniref:Putative multiple banded antigen-like n=1 Tax=Homarus americanus TaxID=6706 RepID=A0A8J5JU33_HOMAM|nr:uncharacterized protein LOC121874669 [Homarus americanus]KAG7161830.1 putative multiple banded antigen-like [Homarus americanus]